MIIVLAESSPAASWPLTLAQPLRTYLGFGLVRLLARPGMGAVPSLDLPHECARFLLLLGSALLPFVRVAQEGRGESDLGERVELFPSHFLHAAAAFTSPMPPACRVSQRRSTILFTLRFLTLRRTPAPDCPCRRRPTTLCRSLPPLPPAHHPRPAHVPRCPRACQLSHAPHGLPSTRGLPSLAPLRPPPSPHPPPPSLHPRALCPRPPTPPCRAQPPPFPARAAPALHFITLHMSLYQPGHTHGLCPAVQYLRGCPHTGHWRLRPPAFVLTLPL